MAEPKVALFMIDGFEETEALTTVDILRRGGVDLSTVSLGSERYLVGRSNITAAADRMFADIAKDEFDMLVIPGGTTAYTEHEGLLKLVRQYDERSKLLAAICAAPAVFGKLGLLQGKRAVIYPGLENWIEGANIVPDLVVTDGHITTAKGPGATVHFALRLLEILRGNETARKVAEAFIAQV